MLCCWTMESSAESIRLWMFQPLTRIILEIVGQQEVISLFPSMVWLPATHPQPTGRPLRCLCHVIDSLLPHSSLEPRAPNIFQHDFDGNPLAPTSIGKHHVLYPCSLHCSTRSAYFAAFLSQVSWVLVSHGTVSSTMTSFCYELD